jgi:hypothetical protein
MPPIEIISNKFPCKHLGVQEAYRVKEEEEGMVVNALNFFGVLNLVLESPALLIMFVVLTIINALMEKKVQMGKGEGPEERGKWEN